MAIISGLAQVKTRKCPLQTDLRQHRTSYVHSRAERFSRAVRKFFPNTEACYTASGTIYGFR